MPMSSPIGQFLSGVIRDLAQEVLTKLESATQIPKPEDAAPPPADGGKVGLTEPLVVHPADPGLAVPGGPWGACELATATVAGAFIERNGTDIFSRGDVVLTPNASNPGAVVMRVHHYGPTLAFGRYLHMSEWTEAVESGSAFVFPSLSPSAPPTGLKAWFLRSRALWHGAAFAALGGRLGDALFFWTRKTSTEQILLVRDPDPATSDDVVAQGVLRDVARDFAESAWRDLDAAQWGQAVEAMEFALALDPSDGGDSPELVERHALALACYERLGREEDAVQLMRTLETSLGDAFVDEVCAAVGMARDRIHVAWEARLDAIEKKAMPQPEPTALAAPSEAPAPKAEPEKFIGFQEKPADMPFLMRSPSLHETPPAPPSPPPSPPPAPSASWAGKDGMTPSFHALSEIDTARQELRDMLSREGWDEESTRAHMRWIEDMLGQLSSLLSAYAKTEAKVMPDDTVCLLLEATGSPATEDRQFLCVGVRVPGDYEGPVTLILQRPEEDVVEWRLADQVKHGPARRFLPVHERITSDMRVHVVPTSARLFGTLVA